MKEKGYHRTDMLKQAKTDACGSKEPGLHPTAEKTPKPLRLSDRRIILQKLCEINCIPPFDSFWWYKNDTSHDIKKLEEFYGHPIKYLKEWSGYSEYEKRWERFKEDFVKVWYKGKK